ncbi:hypothetical protein B0H13DRAFT_1862142 [Mycena leptocephala]|nr:hypothetical protein B0H13DRAFT_1862142 [Mycena leptocephala]
MLCKEFAKMSQNDLLSIWLILAIHQPPNLVHAGTSTNPNEIVPDPTLTFAAKFQESFRKGVHQILAGTRPRHWWRELFNYFHDRRMTKYSASGPTGTSTNIRSWQSVPANGLRRKVWERGAEIVEVGWG